MNQSFEPPTLTGASGIKKYPGLQHYQREKKKTCPGTCFPFNNKQLNKSLSYHTPDLLPLIPNVGH